MACFTQRHRPCHRSGRWAPVVLALAAGASARPARAADAGGYHGPPKPSQVLVVENTHSPDSVALARYYMHARRIPAGNLCPLACPTAEECSLQEYQDDIDAPVQRFLASHHLRVDFIVLTRGIPIRTHEGIRGGFSVDSILGSMSIVDRHPHAPNPYFRRNESFSHALYNLYLVSRLDGYTLRDCELLVDNSLAARPVKGTWLLHVGPGHDTGGYQAVNQGMEQAASILSRKGMTVAIDRNTAFPSGAALAGYFSWGSNDKSFDPAAYHKLTFVPGAIAETAVSTSGRTFRDRGAPGQSLIADLIAQGVTGVKGYVSEPLVDAIALADVLFDRYTSGYSLVESFYMASRYIEWKGVVIGDPLCAPYAPAPARRQVHGTSQAHRHL